MYPILSLTLSLSLTHSMPVIITGASHLPYGSHLQIFSVLSLVLWTEEAFWLVGLTVREVVNVLSFSVSNFVASFVDKKVIFFLLHKNEIIWKCHFISKTVWD